MISLEQSPITTKVSSPDESTRFTLDGSKELEARLAKICSEIRDGVRGIVVESKLEGILLGGGYGRGEGGVMRNGTKDLPYNDLEFYVFVSGNRFLNRLRYEPALHHLADAITPRAGLEVEFNVISIEYLRHSPRSMFYYDLVMGHQLLWGDEHLLDGCEHHRQAARLPTSEATRLMMNRCTGLLFAREKLARDKFSPEDADFVGRNLAKAQLACGDAILTALGEYHWSCRERHERLKSLAAEEDSPWLDEVRQHHAEGLEFKLHPRVCSDSAAALVPRFKVISDLTRQVWLWLESRRFDQPFNSITEYLSANQNGGDNQCWRNRLFTARAFGLSTMFQPEACRHPRERVMADLASLLWQGETSLNRSPSCAARLAQFRKAWQRVR
jgi:hypothetical protein